MIGGFGLRAAIEAKKMLGLWTNADPAR